jgi:hypothetical protein
VVCIALAAAFVIILQIKSSEQLVETSIVATLENHDSSPQPTRHPQKVSQASNPKDSLQSTNYLSVPRVPQHLYPQRLDKYCAKHVPTGDNAEKLTEKIADEFGLDLASLVIAIRHGDRSAIHVLPNSTMKIPDTVLVAPLSRDFTPFFSNLQLNIIEETNSPSQHKGDDLTKALDSRIVFQRSDMTLPQGQLTSRGFAQHLELGQILYDAYGKAYLQTMLEADQVYVRSTNYARTIQSVSALLMTAVPHLVQKAQGKKIAINTYADENKEIMHGLGIRSSSHGIQNPGQASIESHGSCPHAVTATRLERDHFSVTESVMQPIWALFGEKAKVLYPPEVVDTSIPSYCHQRPLPCAIGDESNLRMSPACIEKSHLEKLMWDADRYYCDRYSGSNGGYEATRLATYPFLKEVQDVLLQETSPSKRRLSVFSGHDTVIAPVLASLGVFRTLARHHRPTSHCHWPGYASRIVFERYSTSSNRPTGDNREEENLSNMMAVAKQWWKDHHNVRFLLASVPSSDSSLLEYLQYMFGATKGDSNSKMRTEWVRIVYNGEDITQMIPSCHVEQWIIANVIAHHLPTKTPDSLPGMSTSNSSELTKFIDIHRKDLIQLGHRIFGKKGGSKEGVAFTLCSSHAFRLQVADLIAPSDSFAAACNNLVASSAATTPKSESIVKEAKNNSKDV